MIPYFASFVFGIFIGSFLNVCIYRVPRGMSVALPRSFCPLCSAPLAPAHLVPLASYAALRGRCAFCGGRISARYPAVELLCGLLWAGMFRMFSLSFELFCYGAFFSILLAIVFIDAEWYVIPNPLVLAAMLPAVAAFARHVAAVSGLAPGLGGAAGYGGAAGGAGLGISNAAGVAGAPAGGGLVARSAGAYALASPYGSASPMAPLLGLIPGAAFFLAIYIIALLFFKSDRAIGMGDVKLFIPVGLILGLRLCLIAVFASVFLGGLCGGALILVGRKTKKDSIPLGPFIAIGALAALAGWRFNFFW
ncbi:MAG: prepilin peptidase [Clostridiales bacterium]|nr:prepilin peptidase [Clostridiales bacterium]